MEILPRSEAMVVVALLQGLVDLKGESSMNPEGKLPGDPKEELLGDPEGDFFPGLIWSKIWEV